MGVVISSLEFCSKAVFNLDFIGLFFEFDIRSSIASILSLEVISIPLDLMSTIKGSSVNMNSSSFLTFSSYSFIFNSMAIALSSAAKAAALSAFSFSSYNFSANSIFFNFSSITLIFSAIINSSALFFSSILTFSSSFSFSSNLLLSSTIFFSLSNFLIGLPEGFLDAFRDAIGGVFTPPGFGKDGFRDATRGVFTPLGKDGFRVLPGGDSITGGVFDRLWGVVIAVLEGDFIRVEGRTSPRTVPTLVSITTDFFSDITFIFSSFLSVVILFLVDAEAIFDLSPSIGKTGSSLNTISGVNSFFISLCSTVVS
mmetsp:Transcript_22032/g.21287  ORF Transcript_22032/g.21287 Transcript_22032/m.21287 type:complete len:312 (+) Transcript_22032:781-1716(+)